jgi:hypothetical protein
MDIHSKENSRKSSTYNSRKNSISHKISQYSTSATNRIQGTINRVQDTRQENNSIHRNNKTQIQGKSYCWACAKHKILGCQILKIKSEGFIIPSMMENGEF